MDANRNINQITNLLWL